MQDYCKSKSADFIHWNMVLWLGKNWLTLGRDLVPDTVLEHLFTSLMTEEYGIMDDRFIRTSHSNRPIFMILGEMTDADKVMNPQHFGSNLADTGSESQITFGWG